jgi:cobalt-precorrin-5B (C1)-methyltransferase
MDKFVIKSGKRLRCGYTTGTCAAAATKASAAMLFNHQQLKSIAITVPNGDTLDLAIEDVMRADNKVACCIIKDAGDDPDVTDGLKIYAAVKRINEGIKIKGGIGVGRVTKPGLPCKIGEAAINPVPLKMIQKALEDISKEYDYHGGLEVEIYVPGGEEVAKKTFNGRLGIYGGISILGTTGIVEPMSETALIDTIKVEINSRKENGDEMLLLSPGNYGLDFLKDHLGVDINKAVKYSNFIGEAIDYAAYKEFEKILIVGHVGKLVKIAAGVMNTHSKIADCRNEVFAAHSALVGAKQAVIENIMNSTNTDEIHSILVEEKLNDSVYASILKKIVFNINYRLRNKAKVELIIFSNTSGVVMKTAGADDYIEQYRAIKRNEQDRL